MNGKHVVVTGGAGGFMGGTLVRMFHEAGAKVVAVDSNDHSLQALHEQLPDVECILADIGVPEGVQRVTDAMSVGVDVLCNHAGFSERPLGVLDEVSDEQFDRVISVNLKAPFQLSRFVLPGMVDRGGGVILNTASVAGLRGGRGAPAYTCAKFGLVGLTQHIAATYGKYGIRCNAVAPGPMGIRGPSELRSNLTPRGRDILSRDRDKPAPASPSKVAAIVFFLASDEASFVNGAVVPVDGGWIAY